MALRRVAALRLYGECIRTMLVLQILVLCLCPSVFSYIFCPFSPFILLLVVLSLVRLYVRPCVRYFARFFVRSIVRWSGRSPSRSIVPLFDFSYDHSFAGPNVRPPARSIVPLSVFPFVLLDCCLIFLSSVLSFTFCSICSFFFLSFSLSFFSWFDCSPARAFVPSHVSSSDRSFPGAVVRPPSRSTVPSFDLSYDHSFVGLNVRPPVRSNLFVCLSVRSFGLFV